MERQEVTFMLGKVAHVGFEGHDIWAREKGIKWAG
jgi:hypothetical protein